MAAISPEIRNDRRAGPFDRRRTAARLFPIALPLEGIRVSWGGIWGGVLTAVGLLLLLAALGGAIGITATDPTQVDAGKLGMAAAAWLGIALLIALFVGGMVSTRIGATFDGSTGFWSGALVWVVTLLAMAYLATTSLASLTGGALRVMGGVAQTAAAAMQGTPAANDAAANAANAARNNAPNALARLRSNLENAQANGTIQEKAAEAKPAASKAAWGTFIALVLTLVASLLGAAVGRRRHPSAA
ncbi:MAG TPA: hypothetical protein VLY46_16400 [Usitatibacter sp.]|nr:hypothetical protein [Usitatibacter sp.]